MLNKIIENMFENYGDVNFIKADGFDDAVIGYEESSMRLIYSVTKCIEILINQGLSFTESMERFELNVMDAYKGEKSPIWCNDNF